jgi:hypothetical protein
MRHGLESNTLLLWKMIDHIQNPHLGMAQQDVELHGIIAPARACHSEQQC